jgi:hypothetical protein
MVGRMRPNVHGFRDPDHSGASMICVPLTTRAWEWSQPKDQGNGMTNQNEIFELAIDELEGVSGGKSGDPEDGGNIVARLNKSGDPEDGGNVAMRLR